jgi:hypothetical protein
VREGKLGVWLDDVTEIYVTSAKDVLDVMHNGGINRSIASTQMNAGEIAFFLLFVFFLF